MRVALAQHIKSGGVLLMAVVGANVLNFLFNALLGRWLNFESYSLVALVISFYYISGVVTTAFGATISFVTSTNSPTDSAAMHTPTLRVHTQSVRVASVIGFGWLLIALPMRTFFNLTQAWPIIAFTPVIICSTLVYGMIGYLQGSLRFTAAAALVLIEPVAKLIAGVLLVTLGYGSYAYVAIPISLAVAGFFAFKLLNTTMTKAKKTHESATAAFSNQFFVAAMLVGLSNVVFFSLDILAVKHYFPAAQAGQYAILSLIGKMLFFFSTLTNVFIVPFTARLQQQKHRAMFLLALASISGILATAGYVGLGIFGEQTLPILFGGKVLAVLPLVSPYLLAISALALAQVFISFHLAQQEYLYSALMVAASLLCIALITQQHQSLFQIVQSIRTSCVALLIGTVIAHLLSGMWRANRNHAE